MGWPGNNANAAAAQFDYERSKNGGALPTNCDALRATRDYYNYLTDVRSDFPQLTSRYFEAVANMRRNGCRQF
jgi:hypothetical protein